MSFAATDTTEVHDIVLSAAVAPNTRLAYDKGWACFAAFCTAEQVADPLTASPEVVARYLLDCATRPRPKRGRPLSIGTILLHNSAISRRFVDAGRASPTHHPAVRKTVRGLSRLMTNRPRQVKALREGQVKAMIARCPDSAIGARDAALLALGFAAALRRSELCALRVDDVRILSATREHPRQMLLTIRRSKTDQNGQGQGIAVPEGRTIRPIDRVQRWLTVSGIKQGALFRTMKRGGVVQERPLHHSDIARLVKRYAALVGVDPNEVAGHSLRAGFVTSAAAHHARLDKIMAVTRHTNPATVMRYIRDADAFSDHAGSAFL